VGCGVLGTDVHHIFVIAEELRFLVLYRSVRVQFQFGGGPSVKKGTVSILTLKNGKLSMRVLSNNPKSRWTLDMDK
jgi:hypothetical protein